MSWDVAQGDCRELLRAMPAESVHCVVTSPPYWGLRDYGLPPLMWGGDIAGCEHEWGEEQATRSMTHQDRLGDAPDARKRSGKPAGGKAHGQPGGFSVAQGQFCSHCHAWRGSLGLEPTPELYIAHMVEVFREVKRVLRSDGTLFCNMGDGFQNKQLMGMPWRLAFALQADGWWLRSEIIWAKPNPMPESVRDRPTKAHETVFLLTKAARYYYDAEAIREEGAGRLDRWPGPKGRLDPRSSARWSSGPLDNPAGRNKRTVWTIPTSPFPGAHFATFPPALIEPMILTSPTKCCAVCGRGWERVTETKFVIAQDRSAAKAVRSHEGEKPMDASNTWGGSTRGSNAVATLGFRPGCECNLPPWVPTPGQGKDEEDEVYAERLAPVREEQRRLMATYAAHEHETVPATVCDPFLGSGTSIMVALRHARNAIGLELSKEYAEMARRRIVDDNPMFNGR